MRTVEKNDDNSIKVVNTVVSEQIVTRKQLQREKRQLEAQLRQVNDNLDLIR